MAHEGRGDIDQEKKGRPEPPDRGGGTPEIHHNAVTASRPLSHTTGLAAAGDACLLQCVTSVVDLPRREYARANKIRVDSGTNVYPLLQVRRGFNSSSTSIRPSVCSALSEPLIVGQKGLRSVGGRGVDGYRRGGACLSSQAHIRWKVRQLPVSRRERVVQSCSD